MWDQASKLYALTIKHNAVHFARWRCLQAPLQTENPSTLAAVDAVEQELIARQRAMAQPVAHRFELVPGETAFRPLFNAADLSSSPA